MFDFIKKFRKNETKKNVVAKEKPSNPPQGRKKLSPKEEATAKGEPWVSISKIDVDPLTMTTGEMELDWNSYFIKSLKDAGYQGKDEEDLVEQWLRQVCRGILMELWEQEEANDRPARYTQQRDLGGGKTEVS